jgi:hypothetical protein
MGQKEMKNKRTFAATKDRAEEGQMCSAPPLPIVLCKNVGCFEFVASAAAAAVPDKYSQHAHL